MISRTRRALAAAAALTVAGGATVALASSAQAENDPRAESFGGNARTCADAGLEGDIVDVEFEGGVEEVDQFLTITGTDGFTSVTGIVVKGGPGYNVYVPGAMGLDFVPPWEDLRAPDNRGGQIPTISHWFACGEVIDS